MTPTSEMPTPQFLRRTDAQPEQPLVRHIRQATARCHSRTDRDRALNHLCHAISFRNESFVGFRGDLWRTWREGMREHALAFRKATRDRTRFQLTPA